MRVYPLVAISFTRDKLDCKSKRWKLTFSVRLILLNQNRKHSVACMPILSRLNQNQKSWLMSRAWRYTRITCATHARTTNVGLVVCILMSWRACVREYTYNIRTQTHVIVLRTSQCWFLLLFTFRHACLLSSSGAILPIVAFYLIQKNPFCREQQRRVLKRTIKRHEYTGLRKVTGICVRAFVVNVRNVCTCLSVHFEAWSVHLLR